MWKRILNKLKNKYVLVTLIFVLKVAFFESIDVFTLFKQKQRENQLRAEVAQKKQEVKQLRKRSEQLTDPEERERFAREVYAFKRENEVIFKLSNE